MSIHNDYFGLPTDNSSSTNLKYDIIASKFMTGIQSHNRRSATVQSSGAIFHLIGAVVQSALAVLMILLIGLQWVCRKL